MTNNIKAAVAVLLLVCGMAVFASRGYSLNLSGAGGSSGGGGATPNASSTPQFAALGVGTPAPTATGQADIQLSLGVGEAPDSTAGDLTISGMLATGGNATTGGAAGDILVSRASGGLGVLRLGGTMASPNVQIVSTTDSASNPDLVIEPNSTAGFTVGNVYNQLRSGLTFSNLPACSSNFEGAMASITDSTAAIPGMTIAGSGSFHVMAYCDGTNWTVVDGTPNGTKNVCSGVITLAAGIGNSVVASNSNTGTGTNLAGTCIKNYTNIGCMVISNNNVGKAPATPANTPAVVNCFASPTATATAGMAATATQTAIYAVASTSNSTATVLWWGQY